MKAPYEVVDIMKCRLVRIGSRENVYKCELIVVEIGVPIVFQEPQVDVLKPIIDDEEEAEAS